MRRDVDEVSPANQRQRRDEHGVRRSVGDSKHDGRARHLVEVVDRTRDEHVPVVQQQRERHAVGDARRRLEEARRDAYDVTSARRRTGHDDEDAREHGEGAEAVAREQVHDEGVLAAAEQAALYEHEHHEAVGDEDEDTLDEHRHPHDRIGHGGVYESAIPSDYCPLSEIFAYAARVVRVQSARPLPHQPIVSFL